MNRSPPCKRISLIRVNRCSATRLSSGTRRRGDNFTKWRDSNSELQHYFDLQNNVREVMGNSDGENSFWSKTKTKAQIFLWRYWWSYPDELRYLKGYDVLTSAVQSAETNGFFQTALEHQNAALDQLGISKLNDSFDSIFSSQIDFHSMMSESIVTLERGHPQGHAG